MSYDHHSREGLAICSQRQVILDSSVLIAPPEVCFFAGDALKNSYFYEDHQSNWRGHGIEDFRRELKAHGIGGRNDDGALVSPQDRVMRYVQNINAIDYAGPLAGHQAGFKEINRARFLITNSPKLPQPMKGDFPTLDIFLNELFGVGIDVYGQTQRTLIDLWCARSWKNVNSSPYLLRGHALIFAGSGGSGKNLMQECIITALLGGRVVKAGGYIHGTTTFNGHLFTAEHLLMSDENGARDFRSRRTAGQNMKAVVANTVQEMHHKGREPLTANPRWRLTVSVNDEPEHLQTLPTIGDADMRDKMCLLYVSPAKIPLDEDERQQWVERLQAEIPAWLHHCMMLEVPASMREEKPRMGFKSWQHPELMERLNAFSPQTHLLQLIDQFAGEFFGTSPFEDDGTENNGTHQPFEGNATAARNRLLECVDDKPTMQREVSELLRSAEMCGTYLARLRDAQPERVQLLSRTGNKRTWQIHPPA